MADNYLEKQMDDYRSGRLGIRPIPKRKLGTPLRRIFVIVSPDAVESTITRLKDTEDCYVAFTGLGYTDGNHVAQRTGAQFFPQNANCPTIADVIRRVEQLKGKIDLIIVDDTTESLVPGGDYAISKD